MKAMLLSAICLTFMLGAVAVAADQDPLPGLPKLQSATMSLTWSDFKELLEKLQPVPRPETPQPPPPPPFEWAITRARYLAAAQGDASVRVEARLDIEVMKRDGWTSVPVLSNTVAPVAVTINGQEKTLSNGGNDHLIATIEKPGAYKLETTFFVSCTSQDGVVSFTLPCPKTPLTQMSLSVPVPDAQVESPSAINIDVARGESALTAELAFRSTDSIAVSWTLPAVLKKKPEVAPPPPPEPPRVTSLVSTLASVNDRCIACESMIRYEILRGSADTFRFRLPGTSNILNVTGQGAGWNTSANAGAQAVEVKVNHPITDNYELSVKYETPFEENTTTLKVPALAVLDVARQTGFIGIIARNNAEISTNPASEGAARVDPSDLPTTVRALAPNPILLAFKYNEPSYLVAVDVRRLEDVPVRVATIDSASFVTLITDEGAGVTRVRYNVRNNVKQFLRVDVPNHAEICTVEVGGKMVKPARDAESGAVLIPLFKSAETRHALGAFPVELVYMETFPATPALAGTLTLQTPVADILANEVRWDVLTPNRQCVYWSTGDLSSASNTRYAGGGDGKALSASLAQGHPAVLARLKEKHMENPQTPKTSPPASTAPVPPMASSPETPRADAAPLRFEIPMEGVTHSFRRLIVPEGRQLGLTLYVYNSHVSSAARIICATIELPLGLLAGRMLASALKQRRVVRRKSAIALSAGVIAFVLLHFVVGSPLRALFGGFLAAFLILDAIPRLRTCLKEHQRAAVPKPQPAAGE